MATNSFWGFSTWGSGDWGGKGQDLTIQVGGTNNNTWGRSTWGNGYWNAITPDPGLQRQIEGGENIGWGIDSYGFNAWGGAIQIKVAADANITVLGQQLSKPAVI